MNIKYSLMTLFLVLVLILNMAAWAQLPCPLRLGDVGQAGGVAGVRIKGATATQYPNLDLTGIGDLNKDGLDDFALGFIAGAGTPGYFRIVPGSREGIGTGGVLDVSAGAKGATRNPNGVGISIAGLGDANGNGFNDVLFGDPSVTASGEAYFVDGFSFIELMLSQKTQTTEWIEAHSGARLDGIGDGDDCGWSVSCAGDFNGDGKPDLLVGAPAADVNGQLNAGEVYVIFGNGNGIGVGGVLELDRLNGANGFVLRGSEAYGFVGWSVAGVGDVNGDGYADILIGAPYMDDNGENSGAAYLVYGGQTAPGTSGVAYLESSGVRVKKFVGGAIYDYFGWSVAGGQDVNKDGLKDFIIGANLADNGFRQNTGKAYLFYGKQGGITATLSTLDGSNGVVIPGLDASDQLGFDVAMMKDVNSDGFADILIGAPGAYTYGGKTLGETYLIYGASSLGAGGVFDIYTLDGKKGVRIYGGGMGSSSIESGIRVASAGDVNGDGADDILIGSLGGGDCYLIYGVTVDIQIAPTFLSLDSMTYQRDTFTIKNVGTGLLVVNDIKSEINATHEPANYIIISPTPPYYLGYNQEQLVTVTADFNNAPQNKLTSIRMFVYSNDIRKNPYPGGVYITLNNHGMPTPTPTPTPTPQPPIIRVDFPGFPDIYFYRTEIDNNSGDALIAAAPAPSVTGSKVALVRGEIDPAMDKGFTTGLRAAGTGRHILMQFNQAPTDAGVNALEKEGVKLLQYLPENTWWVAIGPDVKSLNDIRACGGVRWASTMPTEYKIASVIDDKEFSPNILYENGEVLFHVLTFSDVSDDEFQQALQGLTFAHESRGKAFGNVWVIRTKPENVPALAALDCVEWIEPAPSTNKVCNENVRRRANVDPLQVTTNPLWDPRLGQLGFVNGVDGTGIKVGVWDAYAVDAHKDFNFTRVFSGDGTTVPEVKQLKEPWWWEELYGDALWETNFYTVSHATHVAGTIGSNGLKDAQLTLKSFLMGKMPGLTDCEQFYMDFNRDFKIDVADIVMSQRWKISRTLGIAPGCDIYTYDYSNDTNEMANAVVRYKIDITNNAYSAELGWEVRYYEIPDPLVPNHVLYYPYWVYLGNGGEFGRYTTESSAWDKISYETGLLIVKASGNDRGDGPDAKWDVPTSKWYCVDGPYDCIDPKGSAKNVITVGAVGDDGEEQFASSAGPVDDGRIKPDLVANGYTVLSLGVGNCYYDSIKATEWALSGLMGDQTTTTITFDKFGSSNACAAVTGCGVLLQQLYDVQYGIKAKPETIKALLIQGAMERGTNPGPDYVYGWGEVNVYNSSQYILNDAVMNGMVRAGANPVRFPVDVPSGLTSLKATVVWTDKQGAPESKVALINDIDLVLVNPNGQKFYPWNLDPWDPQAAATKGANHVDNVEQVQVDSPISGAWEAQVIPYNIPAIQQNFTIVINGIKSVKLTKSIKVFNDGGGDLILNSITPDRTYDWLSITCGGKAVKDIVIKSGEYATIDLTVDFAYSPEGQTALLTFKSNAANEKPVVIVHVLP